MFKKLTLLIVMVFSILVWTSCSSKDNTQTAIGGERELLLLEKETTAVTVYYATLDEKYLVPLTFSVNATREAAKVALEKLLAGAPNDFVKSPLSADTKLKDVYAQGEIVFVDLTKEFSQINEEYARLASAALAATVLPLLENSQMQLLLNGKPYQDVGSVKLSEPIKEGPINPVSPIGEDQPYIVYYFGDQQAQYMVPQSAPVNKDDAEYKAEQTVKAILKGPKSDSNLYSSINKKTKLLALQVSNGIVTLDFSADLLDYSGSSAEENVLVKSLLYSLTSIEGIDAVQILIEGQIKEYLPAGTDISTPLKAVEKINVVA
ncbi:MAG: GerMN domain-containing protein [Clostridia bacterium]|nr:GerMN domain-containing protein [Clostridia bacterium]